MIKLYSSILGLHKVFHSWDIFPYVNAQFDHFANCKHEIWSHANESTNTFIKEKT